MRDRGGCARRPGQFRMAARHASEYCAGGGSCRVSQGAKGCRRQADFALISQEGPCGRGRSTRGRSGTVFGTDDRPAPPRQRAADSGPKRRGRLRARRASPAGQPCVFRGLGAAEAAAGMPRGRRSRDSFGTEAAAPAAKGSPNDKRPAPCPRCCSRGPDPAAPDTADPADSAMLPPPEPALPDGQHLAPHFRPRPPPLPAHPSQTFAVCANSERRRGAGSLLHQATGPAPPPLSLAAAAERHCQASADQAIRPASPPCPAAGKAALSGHRMPRRADAPWDGTLVSLPRWPSNAPRPGLLPRPLPRRRPQGVTVPRQPHVVMPPPRFWHPPPPALCLSRLPPALPFKRPSHTCRSRPLSLPLTALHWAYGPCERPLCGVNSRHRAPSAALMRRLPVPARA